MTSAELGPTVGSPRKMAWLGGEVPLQGGVQREEAVSGAGPKDPSNFIPASEPMTEKGRSSAAFSPLDPKPPCL